MPKKEKIPPPGAKSDQYTNFFSKPKWKQALAKPTLDLAGRNMRGPGALTVGNALAKSKFVTVVDLSGNHLGDDGAIEFAQCLKTNDMIGTISLACNEITDVGGIAIASAFIPTANPSGQPGQWNRSVSMLNLAGNLLKDDSLFALCNAAVCHTDLYMVDLQYNKIGPLGAKGMWRMMQRQTLCTFVLHHNALGDEGTALICAAWKRFGKTGTQAKLNLSCNDICKSGAEAVGELVRDNEFTTDVNLSWNTLGEKGMQLFTAKLLPPPSGGPSPKTVLVDLNVSYCRLGDGGACELAKLLEQNFESLIKINAARNDIKDRGGVALARAMAKNTVLHTVNFAENEFGDKTVDEMVAAIGAMKSLQKVVLRRCGLTDRHKDKLSSVAKNPPTIDAGARDDAVMLTEFLDKVKDYMEAHKPDENEGKKKKKGKAAKA